MSKGKWVKTKIREAYAISKKKWQAYWTAKEEFYKKNPTVYWKEILASVLKKVDPVETAAILGGTILVHEFIFASNEFKSALEVLAPEHVVGFNPYGVIQNIIKKMTGEEIDETYTQKLLNNEVILWLLAFSISYFAVKHGAELLPTAKQFFGLVL